tara:strand:+ start:2407 stop:3633 length:1227 start_codon:yes stop_codon:yes gene_type:complete
MIQLAYDWIGPEGPWPNGQSLDLLTSPNTYEHAQYAINNNIYNLESKRHSYTFSKIHSILGKKNVIQKHILQCNGKFIYELTPLLKPYQWTDAAFDNVSSIAIHSQQIGKCLFVINDMNEGYSNKDYNFFEHIHKQIKRYSLNPRNILYITMNSVAEKEYTQWALLNNISDMINIQSVYLYEFIDDTNTTIKKPSKHFICLNRQPNPLRQCLIYELWRRDLLKFGHVSMPDPHEKLDCIFDKNNLKLFNIDDSRWKEFLKTLPYIADGRSFLDQTCNVNSITDFYYDSVYSIITENTIGEVDCIKLSEKTFRSLGNYCLPLHMYSKGTGKQLARLGYKLDCKEYDNIVDDTTRFWALINKIEKICQININTLHNQTKQMRLDNRQNIINRKLQSINQPRDFIYKWLGT